LEQLGEPIPDVATYDQGEDEKLSWEEEVVALIDTLRTEREQQAAKSSKKLEQQE
jgi:hypothetical protein